MQTIFRVEWILDSMWNRSIDSRWNANYTFVMRPFHAPRNTLQAMAEVDPRFEPFLQSWDLWKATVLRPLLHKNPRLLLRLLALCDSAEGMFQSELIRRLGVGQSSLSKLIKKLVAAGWISVHSPAMTIADTWRFLLTQESRRSKISASNWRRRRPPAESGAAPRREAIIPLSGPPSWTN